MSDNRGTDVRLLMFTPEQVEQLNADAAELARYREREPLVQALFDALARVDMDKTSDAIGLGFGPVLDAIEAIVGLGQVKP